MKACDAVIAWNTDPHAIGVFDRAGWKKVAWIVDRWQNTSGAVYRDWLKGDERSIIHPWQLQPEGVFSELITSYKFNTVDLIVSVLKQFALIDECEWARKMLAPGERP